MVLTLVPSTSIGKPTKLEYFRMFCSTAHFCENLDSSSLSLITILVPLVTPVASERSYVPSPVDDQQCATSSPCLRE